MALHEIQPMTGILTIVVRDVHGALIMTRRHPNLITNVGKTLVAQLFTGEISGKPEILIAVGDSSLAARITDTKLGNQLDQVVATSAPIKMQTLDNVQRSSASANVTASFPPLAAGNAQILREAGILMRLPNREPVLYNHVNFADITRTDNLEMTLTWEVLF